ncbi:MAG: polysaccharide biosynthesis C-terminal domain-containing protein, partial [Patescibacteria group bacterium]
GNTALGIYGAGYRFLESLSLIPTALAHNLFPIASKDGVVTKRQVQHITLTMTVFGVIIGLLLYLFSEYIILILLGVAYKQVIPILQIFSVVVVLFFISSPLTTIVQSSSMVKQFLPWGIGNTMLNILLNIALIPILGINGAAWTMLITELTGLLINIYFVHKLYLKSSV